MTTPKLLLPILLLIFLMGCDAFEVNPYAIRLEADETNLTAKQLSKLQERVAAHPNKQTVNIAFISDSQRALDEFDDAIDHINQNPNIDMVFHGGDMTDYALNIEYKKSIGVLGKLQIPFFTSFGNHDALATGVDAYQVIFGSLDYSFKAWGHKFIFFNGNHLEFMIREEEVPNFSFLNEQIFEESDDFQNIFMISHIGPFHEEFGSDNSEAYHQLMISDQRIKLSMHGHGHSHQYGELYGSGFNYLMADNAADRNYIILTIQSDGSYTYHRVFY